MRSGGVTAVRVDRRSLDRCGRPPAHLRGATLLHVAAEYGFFDATSLLLDSALTLTPAPSFGFLLNP